MPKLTRTPPTSKRENVTPTPTGSGAGGARAGATKKATHVGAPACFQLEQCCQQLRDAFGEWGIYLVGSALERADWRDVDVRYILSDEEFAKVFPDAGDHWEHDPRWLILTTAIAGWLSKQTGLPIDFQFQPQTHANKRHAGLRSALGIRIKK